MKGVERKHPSRRRHLSLARADIVRHKSGIVIAWFDNVRLRPGAKIKSRVKLSILDPLSRKRHSTVIENTVKMQFLLITRYGSRYIVLHRNARNFIIFHEK